MFQKQFSECSSITFSSSLSQLICKVISLPTKAADTQGTRWSMLFNFHHVTHVVLLNILWFPNIPGLNSNPTPRVLKCAIIIL